MTPADPGAAAGARCLATLTPLAEEGMTRAAQRDLAGPGHQVFPTRLDLVRSEVVQHRLRTMQRFSISGMQDKISLRLDRGRLHPVERDGTHILKPIPGSALALAEEVPANEHLTMLIARTLGIRTAACGLVRLRDGELAYVTRRFDRRVDGSKLLQEDFGVLAQLSERSAGPNYKYTSSYEEIGRLVLQFSSAQQADLEEFFRRVVFCFAIGNGDAHIRNFSVLRETDGFVQLSPAYDLLCTSVHLPSGSDLALSLFAAERQGAFSPSYSALGFHSASDFRALADALSLRPAVRDRVLRQVGGSDAFARIEALVDRSFLGSAARERYLSEVRHRFRKLDATTGG